MLAHRYQIWPGGFGFGGDWDRDDPIEKRYVGITTIAKRDRASQYEVFNELLAMRLGQLIGLPVPAGVALERDGKTYFASCHLLAAGGELPKADFGRFAHERRRDACGVVVFDSWIANTDRHDDNLWYDYYGGIYVIFDHGRALLNGSGQTHLLSQQGRLGIRLDPPCLAPHILSFGEFAFWYDRILALPSYSIREAVAAAALIGIDQQLANQCADWLLNRRVMLPAIFRENLASFPKAEPTAFDPFGGYDHVCPEYYI